MFKDNTEILSYYIQTDIEGKEVLVINSGAIDETQFSISLLKRMKVLIDSMDRVVLTSSNIGVGPHLYDKYNMIYNEELGAYIKVSEEE